MSAAEEADVPTVGSDSDQKRLLLPVLGSEKVNVFLKLDLILLNQSAELTLDEDDVKVELKKSSSAN